MSAKFPTTMHAALFEMSMIGADLGTGEAHGFGNAWWFRVTEPETIEESEYGEVTVLPGNYGLSEDDHGFLYVTQYDTWAEAEAEHARIDTAYGEWLEAEETCE